MYSKTESEEHDAQSTEGRGIWVVPQAMATGDRPAELLRCLTYAEAAERAQEEGTVVVWWARDADLRPLLSRYNPSVQSAILALLDCAKK